jgi:hypothetical protein
MGCLGGELVGYTNGMGKELWSLAQLLLLPMVGPILVPETRTQAVVVTGDRGAWDPPLGPAIYTAPVRPLIPPNCR